MKVDYKAFVHKTECAYKNFDFLLHYGGRQPMEISGEKKVKKH